MKVKAKYVYKQVNELWPNLDNRDEIIPWDREYWLMSQETVGRIMELSNVPEMTFIPDFNDCDDFALHAQSETRRKRYLAWMEGKLSIVQRYPVAVAIAWGSMWRGMSKNHVANLFVCKEGIYLADFTPMERRYWKAEPDNDHMLKVDFR